MFGLQKRQNDARSIPASITLPLKRKLDSARFMWLLQYEEGFYGNTSVVETLLYSSKERAIEALPSLMDKRSNYGSDWRNGLIGLGKENSNNYLGLEYFVNKLGEEGGDLLSNERIDSRDTIKVSLKRMQIDQIIESKPKWFDWSRPSRPKTQARCVSPY